jgi:hypothetical protein
MRKNALNFLLVKNIDVLIVYRFNILFVKSFGFFCFCEFDWLSKTFFDQSYGPNVWLEKYSKTGGK